MDLNSPLKLSNILVHFQDQNSPSFPIYFHLTVKLKFFRPPICHSLLSASSSLSSQKLEMTISTGQGLFPNTDGYFAEALKKIRGPMP